jgi:hypothetical protein
MHETPSPRKNRRLNRRLPPKGRVKVVCQKGSMWMGADLALSVLDLSESGARLAVRSALAPGQQMSLTLDSPTNVRPVRRLGTVAWALALADGVHVVGISFDKRLDYTDLLHLT